MHVALYANTHERVIDAPSHTNVSVTLTDFTTAVVLNPLDKRRPDRQRVVMGPVLR
jgi:hypothetical protein